MAAAKTWDDFRELAKHAPRVERRADCDGLVHYVRLVEGDWMCGLSGATSVKPPQGDRVCANCHIEASRAHVVIVQDVPDVCDWQADLADIYQVCR